MVKIFRDEKAYQLIICVIVCFLIVCDAQAQNIGINSTGATPDNSAGLDISFSNKGILIPRVALIATNKGEPINSPATSLLVYNTATVNDVTPGYYYNTGTPAVPFWTKLLTTDVRNNWSLTGNFGMVDSTHFIGTMDHVPLNFRVNNQRAGRIDSVRQNTSIGYRSLELATGGRNTAFGYHALRSNTIGNLNTANGHQALYSNTIGNLNTANGNQALYTNTTGDFNTANGHQALYSNTTGNLNTANGAQSLYSNTIGSHNTANGNLALYSNTEGSYNIANGNGALRSNTSGGYNTANGNQSLYSNTSGNYNTANGTQALYSNISGGYNTANGNSALYSSTNGSYNTANGNSALYSNTNGSYNTANGSAALRSNTIGNYNTANGNGALSSNTEGSHNMANGSTALRSNRTGAYNTANGSAALYSNTTGSSNTAGGHQSLYSNTTGSRNVAIGDSALYSNRTGSDNTGIGSRVNIANNLVNATAIGARAYVSASNSLVLGAISGVNGATANTNVGIGISDPQYQLHLSQNSAAKPGSSAWDVASDARLKTDIHDYKDGLSVLQFIRPVYYTYNGKAGMPQDTEIGVIAQELQQSAPYMVSEWEYNNQETGETETYLNVNNGAMTYMLINAVKEQQDMIQKLKEENQEAVQKLREENEALLQRLEKIEKLLEDNPGF